MGRPATVFAIALAAATLYAGIHFGSTTAGGADSYGYVSEAGLFLQRRIAIREDIVRQSPWPHAADTWAPLGFRASPHAADAIVPLYAPGLPALMAIVQAAAGFCAAFVVVPLCGALTVWLTFVAGQRLFERPLVSTASAVLVASSPIFLYQLMNPMSDVPVTAAWTAALVAAASGWPLAAGVASGIAVAIRPNLAAAAIALLAWHVIAGHRPLRYAAGVAPFVAAIGLLNASAYESAVISGYGTLDELYAWSHWRTNVRQFAVWTVETQTPVVAVAALYIAAPRLFAPSRVRHPRLLIVGFAAAVTLSYVFYQPFDAWWYLRFLLPLWPVMMVLTAAALDAAARPLRAHGVAPFVLAIALLAASGAAIAAKRYAFDVGRSERRYIDVARFVQARTEPQAVMFAVQHSGTLRLYGGRLTLRFDQLDPAWLERAIAFLAARGRHPYIVVEAGERTAFIERFGGQSDVGRLGWAPLGALADANVLVYDALDRSRSDAPLAISNAASRRIGWRCDRPAVWPPPVSER